MSAHHPWLGEELQRLVESNGVDGHRFEQRRRLRFRVRVRVTLAQLHIGAESAVPNEHGQARLGVVAERTIIGRSLEELGRLLDAELIDGEIVGDGSPIFTASEIRPILPTAGDDLGTIGIGAHGERVHRPGIDRFERLVRHEIAQTSLAVTEIELLQPGNRVGLAAGDGIEILLHAGGEVVVHIVPEIALEETHDGERAQRRHESGALFSHVSAVLDGGDDRGVGRRATDTQLFESLDQRRFGVTRRRLRFVVGRFDPDRGHRLTLDEIGEDLLLIVAGGLRIVDVFDVRLEEPAEQDGPTRCLELDVAARVDRGRSEPHVEALSFRVLHLTGDRALPDEVVQPGLVRPRSQCPRHGRGILETVPRRPDRLVSLLRVLGGLSVRPGPIRQVLGAEAACDEGPSGGDGRSREVRRIGAHVRDVPGLVETLGGGHRPASPEPQFPSRLLLQGGGPERGVRLAGVRLAFDASHRESGSIDLGGQELDRRGIQDEAPLAGIPVRIEILAGGDPVSFDGHQDRVELRRPVVGGHENPLDARVDRCDERDALPFASDEDPGRRRLHAPRRQASLDAPPQHG